MKTGKFITNIDFNSKYKDILLTIPANDYIKLYNISNQNNFEIVSLLNGESTKNAHYSKFNPVYENLIISSKDIGTLFSFIIFLTVFFKWTDI